MTKLLFTYGPRMIDGKYDGMMIVLNGNYLCEIAAHMFPQNEADMLAKEICEKLTPFKYAKHVCGPKNPACEANLC
jgi:hypothetical protein